MNIDNDASENTKLMMEDGGTEGKKVVLMEMKPVEERCEAPVDVNDADCVNFEFIDDVDGPCVHIAPAPSLPVRGVKNRTSQYIRRKIKMKNKTKSNEEVQEEIVELPTTCFGDVEFRGASRRSRSKFIRISNDTPPKVIYKLLVKYWKMEPPRLLISVTGGAKNFNMSPMLKQNFVVGLSKVASTPGAWVITGGTNCGVMKYVGEALQGSTKACIGIATWGVISKREDLNPDTCRRCEINSNTCNANEPKNSYSYEVGSWLTEDGAYLDSNHTHFLLVDDGNVNNYGVEIPTRGALEQYIMADALKADDGIKTVPSVLLVLEGGPGTVGTIHSAVTGDNPVPVVIVKSSGRAADLFAYALTLSTEILEADEDGVHEGLVQGIETLFQGLNENKLKQVYRQVLECLAFEHMFTISQVGTDVDIDDAILTALLNDKSTSPYRQLQLTLVWNRADLARAKILGSLLSWAPNDPMELQWLMIMSLAMNNVEFVEILMEYGVCISAFLTEELMNFLYGFRSYDKSSPLRSEFHNDDYEPIPAYSKNLTAYKTMCSQDDLVSTSNVMLPRERIERLIHELCHDLIRKGNEGFVESNVSDTFDCPFRELYYWAILNNMQDMALYFWTKGEEHMAKALVGSHLCEALMLRRINQGDIETSLTETSNIFRENALKLLDNCYTCDEYQTRSLITYDLEHFNELNVMKLATRSENLDFVSHYAVQGLLEDVWLGNLKMKQIGLIKIFFSYLLILPVLIKTFYQFRTHEEILTLTHNGETDEVDEEDDDEVDSNSSKNDISNIADRRKTVKQKKAQIDRGKGTELSNCRKLLEFYWNTPIVIFVTHVSGYILFLILFSYVSMLKKETQMPDWPEWLLIVTVIAYFVAEVYQLTQMSAPSWKAMFTQWAHSGLNLFDAFVMIFYFVALGCRLSTSKTVHKAGHVMYSIDCGLWIFRLLPVCFISPTLGPYLVMIKKMTKDLMIFLSVLIVVVIGYGVMTTSILTPFKSANIKMIRNPLWQPYFNLYGELFTEREPESLNETRFGTPVSETLDETIVWILLAIYLLFTNILLVNLLIAVLSNTYNVVQEKSSQIWAFKRYHLIMEYADRHALFPPLSLLGHTFLLIKWCIIKCCRINRDKACSGLKTEVSSEQREELLQFEVKCLTIMTRRNYSNITKDVNEMTTEILEELDDIKSEMIVIKEKVFNKSESKNEEEAVLPTSPISPGRRKFSAMVMKNVLAKET